VNENPNDAEIAATLRAAGVQDPTRPRDFHTTGWDGQMRFVNDFWHFTAENDEGETKSFKIATDNPERAQISAAKYLSKSSVQIRELSKDEKLYCARLAGMGKREECILNFISYSVPDYDGQFDISTDPRYQKVCDASAWFTFINSTPAYQDSDEVREFITTYIGNRVVTVQLLEFGFKAYLENQKKADRGTARQSVRGRRKWF
jgi:hypothetical protein